MVLWEIFSFGQLPYSGIENVNIYQHLADGKRLEKPEMCSDEMLVTGANLSKCLERELRSHSEICAINFQLWYHAGLLE